MPRHPLFNLLLAAAEDVDATFTNGVCEADISYVVQFPHDHWVVVDKFKDLKQAHAEGKQIEFKFLGHWRDCTDSVMWNTGTQYRVKPEPVYEYRWLCKNDEDHLFLTTEWYKKKEDLHHLIQSFVLREIAESKREVKQ
jgi:hypothetical protein